MFSIEEPTFTQCRLARRPARTTEGLGVRLVLLTSRKQNGSRSGPSLLRGRLLADQKGLHKSPLLPFCIVVCAICSSQARGWRERNCAQLRLQIGATPERVTCSPDLLGCKVQADHLSDTLPIRASSASHTTRMPDYVTEISMLIRCISQIYKAKEMCSKSTR